MSTTSAENYAGIDVGIGIAASGVVLDLNSFSITVSNADTVLGHHFYGIAELGTFSHVTIKNGTVIINSPTLLGTTSRGWGAFKPVITQ